MWSSSTFKIIEIFGKKLKKLLVYSQASVTKYGELPTRILPPMVSKMPPTEMVGSAFAAIKMSETMEVVVVLPWVPLTAIGHS